MSNTAHPIFGEYISVYTRKQAIEDGALVEAPKGSVPFKYHTALTAAAWGKYVAFDSDHFFSVHGQSESGRLWDIGWMLLNAIKRQPGEVTELLFKLYVAMPDKGDWERNEEVPERSSGLSRETHRHVTLKAICGPGDDAEPVITIMLPWED